MADTKPKLAVIEIEAACPTHSRTEVSVRDTQTIIDEPVERGGTNQGPSPTETLIAAVTGCTNVVLNHLAKANGANVKSLHVAASAEFDRRGPMLIAEVAVPFPTLHLTIELATDADESTVAKLKDGLHRYCPLHTVMAGAGTKITETWNVTRG